MTDDPATASERLTHHLEIEDFRRIFDASPTGCLLVDSGGVICDLNATAERVLGYVADELVGAPVETLVPGAARDRHGAHRDDFVANPTPRPMGIGLELFAVRKDGSELPVEIALSPVHTSEGMFILASINDITQRRRLRAFGAGVLQGAEEERQRIARELHDDTAQALAALVLRLQMARRTDDPDRRDELLGEMHSEIRRTSDGVRRILRGLRPAALEEAGVVAAIRAQARDVLDGAGVGVALEAAPIDDHLDSQGKLALYRIVQEALSNVVRHAHAANVTIRLSVSDGMVYATVSDDGRGFVTDAVRPSEAGRGLGIIGMQERANILGGSVRLESGAGTGTTVTVQVPTSAKEAT